MFDNIQLSTPTISYLLWLIYLAVAILVTRRCIGYKRFNTFTLYLPLLLVTNGILTPLSIEVNSSITGYELSDVAFHRAWVAVGLMYLTMPIGVMTANLFRTPRPVGVESPIVRQTERTGPLTLFIVFSVLLSLVSLVQIYLDGIQLDVLRFFTGFDSYAAYAAQRYTFAAVTASWPYYLYHKLPYAIAPMALILLWNHQGVSRKLRLSAIAVITFSILQTGHKLPLVIVVITLLASSFLIRHNMIVPVRARLLTAAAFLALLFVYLPIEYLIQGEQSYAQAVFWSVERVFVESYRGLHLYFEVYPDYHPFLHGLSARAVAAALNVRDYISVSVYIPQVFLGIENTSYPALFIGEAWADFGYVGVVVYSVIVGFLLQIYNVMYYNKSTHYLEDAALLIAVGISTIHLGHSNLVATAFTYGLGTHIAIFFFLKKFGVRGRTVRSARRIAAAPDVVSAT